MNEAFDSNVTRISGGSSDRPTVLFPHIPRTGGDTLNLVLQNYYTQQRSIHFNETYQAWKFLRELEDTDLECIRCFRGHGIYYGIHRYIPRSCTYIQIFRDPVERVISQYYLYMTDTENPMHSHIKDNNITLEEFQQANANLQSMYILGFPHVHQNYPDPADIPLMRQRLEKCFSFLGVTDMFDESIFMLKHALNWKSHVFWQKRRENKKRPPREEIPADLQEKIKLSHLPDSELYHFARQQLASKIDSLSPQLKKELVLYKKGRSLYYELLKNKPPEVLKTFISDIIQPDLSRVAILGNQPKTAPYLEEYIKAANDMLGRSPEVKCYISENMDDLQEQVRQESALGFLKSADLVVALPLPAQDYLIKELVDSLELPRARLVYALMPPAL